MEPETLVQPRGGKDQDPIGHTEDQAGAGLFVWGIFDLMGRGSFFGLPTLLSITSNFLERIYEFLAMH